MGRDSSSSTNLAYLKLPRWRSHLTEGFVTANGAQNKLEYQQAWYLYPLENKAITEIASILAN